VKARTLAVLLVAIAIAGGAVGSAITLAIRGDDDTVVRGEFVRVRPLATEAGLAHEPFCVELHHFCITEPQQGQLFALYTADPHPIFREQGCTVHWDAMAQQVVGSPAGAQDTIVGLFIGNCSGSTFDISGKRLFGPSTRDLDRFPIASTPDGLVVNTKTLICGELRVDLPSNKCPRAPAID